MSKQYIYIFSNTERSDLVKIGCTATSNPRDRAQKLSRETGAIGQFIPEFYMEVPDAKLAEAILHFRCREAHYEKEYYKIDLQKVIITACIEMVSFFEIEEPAFFVRGENKFYWAQVLAKIAMQRISQIAVEITNNEVINSLESEKQKLDLHHSILIKFRDSPHKIQ